MKALRPGLDSDTRLSSHPLVKGTLSSLTPVAHSAHQFDGYGPLHNPVTPYPLVDTPLSKDNTGTSHGNITQMPMISAAPFRKTRKKRNSVFITLLILLFLLLLSSSLGALYWVTYHHTSTNISPLANQVVGHAFFVSSGQINENSTQGLNNELQINLSHIPGLPSGKSYYAWLLSDINTSPGISILLSTLPVNSGTVNYLYHSDQQQTNLFATYSRLLITEEDTNNVPSRPSTERNTWRYYAVLPQIPTATDHTRVLDYLRFLLSEDPLLLHLGIHGGLNLQLYRNIQQVVELANSASKSSKSVFIRDLVISILDYLDGTSYVQNDVPRGTPLMVDQTSSKVPIIGSKLPQFVSSYLDRISDRLSSLTEFPDVTPATKTQAKQINLALSSYIQSQLEQARKDAKQLANLSDTQLLQPSSKSIMIDMQTQVNYAFNGQIDPATGQKQEGISQLSADIQRLATFDITVYKP